MKVNEFQLLSVRSEGQFNTVVYEEEDIYRGQDRRNIVLMNKSDMNKLNFLRDDKVVIKNDIGTMENIHVRPFEIKKGAVLMYYPEVNTLISQNVDPLSKTPGFKSMIVSVKKADSSYRKLKL